MPKRGQLKVVAADDVIPIELEDGTGLFMDGLPIDLLEKYARVDSGGGAPFVDVGLFWQLQDGTDVSSTGVRDNEGCWFVLHSQGSV